MALYDSGQFTLNTNLLGDVSASFDISAQTIFSFCVLEATGTHTNHEIELEFSLDDANWHATEKKVPGLGFQMNIPVSSEYARLRVSQAEGATSTVNAIIQGK